MSFYEFSCLFLNGFHWFIWLRIAWPALARFGLVQLDSIRLNSASHFDDNLIFQGCLSFVKLR